MHLQQYFADQVYSELFTVELLYCSSIQQYFADHAEFCTFEPPGNLCIFCIFSLLSETLFARYGWHTDHAPCIANPPKTTNITFILHTGCTLYKSWPDTSPSCSPLWCAWSKCRVKWKLTWVWSWPLTLIQHFEIWHSWGLSRPDVSCQLNTSGWQRSHPKLNYRVFGRRHSAKN